MVYTDGNSPYEEIRVLVLEDEVHIRKIICRLLRQIGIQLIHEAANGEEGFKEMIRVRPQLILCDIHMEPINGMEFLQRLRGLSKPEFSELPLVFLTADMKSETVELARGLRVDGYLVKPVSLKALKDRVDAALFPAEA
jgi:two-component system, chemotaxis family, chemotaxis protein CheY